MSHAYLTFHGDLNDLLAPDLRGQTVPYPLDDGVSVKHAIEALGVPHPEIELIRVDGAAVGFDYQLREDDTVDVYPATALPPDGPRGTLRPPWPRPARFVLDTHLGRLAAYLRAFGFDALYRNDADDVDLAAIAAAESRILLSRDRGLLKRKAVIYGYCVRDTDPRQQITDVLQRFASRDEIRLWQRCLHCNGELVEVDKAAIYDRLEPKTQRYYDDYSRCTDCGQIYWRGSHVDAMLPLVEEVLARLDA